MQSRNTSVSGVWRKDNASGATISTGTRPLSYETVVAGATVQGDHKTPLPWRYSVAKETYQNGKIGDYFTSGALFQNRYGPTTNNTLDSARLKLIPAETANAYNSALDRLNEKVRGSLDLSVGLAELGATRRMLNITDGLTSTIKGFQKSNLSVVERLAHEVGSRYLEWRYGWQPLLSDIYDSADESVRYVLNQIEDVRTTATMKMPKSQVQSISIESGTLYGIPVDIHGKTSCLLSLRYKTDGHDVDRWASLNPVGIAWETLPYSFVADWFVDVGSALRNLETSLLYRNSFLGGYSSELYVCECSYQYKSTQPGIGGYFIFDLNSYRKNISFERKILTSYPVGRLPSFSAKLGAQRLLSAAALLEQFLHTSRGKTTRSPRFSGKYPGLNFWERRASNLLLKHGLVR